MLPFTPHKPRQETRVSLYGLLAAASAMILIAAGCTNPSQGCGPFPDKFDVTGFNTSEKYVTYRVDSLRTLQLSSEVPDTLQYNEFALNVVTGQDVYFSANQPAFRFRLVPEAQACSPALPVTEDTIQNLEIISSADFGDNFPAGSDVSSLFDVYANFPVEGIRLSTDSEFELSGSSVPDEFTFLLNTSPREEISLFFTLRLEIDGANISEHEYTTRELVISPG